MPRGRPFKKGQSGNPGGRIGVPKDIREAAQQHTPAAIETLAKCLKDGKAAWAAKVAAATALLDRAWGKPQQHVSIDVASQYAEFLESLAGRDADDPAVAERPGGLRDRMPEGNA